MRQYINPNFKYVKILKGTKKPFEQDWVNKGYSWNEIQDWVKSGNNYGIICGFGDLIVIDSDEPSLAKRVSTTLPPTFRVKTGGGGTHDYYICPEVKKKIILQKDKHYGEVQSYGTQIVCAGSIHPNGNKYSVLVDNEISVISYDQLLECISPYLKEVKVASQTAVNDLKTYGESDINSIRITDVIDTTGFRSGNKGELFGANPWHGSGTGMNLWINRSKNVAHCFRCNTGINVAKAIALNEKIISNCNEQLDRAKFIQVLHIAQDKYGLPKGELRDNLQKAIPIFVDFKDLARKFIEIYPLHYDNSKIWWAWDNNDKRWVIVDETDLLNMVSIVSQANTVAAQSKNMIIEALKQISRTNKPREPVTTWIQFKDKIVDVTTEESFDVSSAYFITNPIPWKIGDSEDTPTMDRIFTEWVGEKYVPTLYEILAYCLIPSYPIERIFCFIGSGSNGKSCYLQLLRKFIGDYNVTATDLNTLVKSRFEVTRLHKKLVCQMGETDFNELNNTQLVKKIVSGKDVIGFEYKNKTPFDGLNYAKLLIATNNLPTTSDKTAGFYRRWTIIDFPNTFSESVDVLSTIPDEEYENLAKKSIGILKELLKKRTFTNDGEIADRIKRYEERSDPLEKFFTDEIEEMSDTHIFKYEFRKRLDDWCSSNRFRKLTDSAILKKMKEKNITSGKVTAEWYSNSDNGQKPRYNAWIGISWKNSITDTGETK